MFLSFQRIRTHLTGSAVLATGVVLLYREHKARTSASPTRVSTRRTEFTPLIGSDVVGGSWQMRF